MKYRITLMLAILVGPAIADNSSYSCSPALRCVEEQGPTYDIGRGARIALPSGWRYFSYPTAPDPAMAGLREIRAFKDGVIIAISPFPNVERWALSEPWLRFQSPLRSRHIRQSREKAIKYVSMLRDDIVGCYASLTAVHESEKPFDILPNRRHSSVTSFLISHKFIIFSILVVSERLPDEGYLAAVDAIRDIQ
jgi:hypothetical protein